MLKKIILSFVAFVSLAHAAPRQNVGLGVVFGEPTGLTAKFWKDQHAAFDAGLAFSLSDSFLIYGDYLFHFPGAFGRSSQFATQLKPYLGIGGVLVFSADSNRSRKRYFDNRSDSLALGARVPLGIEWTPSDPSIGVFVEIVPGVGLIPATYAFLQGGIGARYYF